MDVQNKNKCHTLWESKRSFSSCCDIKLEQINVDHIYPFYLSLN